MRLKSLAALAAAVFLGNGDDARATFDFSTAFDNVTVTGTSQSYTITNETAGSVVDGITFTNGGVLIAVGGTTVGLLNEGRTGYGVPGSDSINVGNVIVNSTTAPPTSDTFNINYRDSITITNNPPPGTSETSAPLPFTGTLAFSKINTGQGSTTNTFLSQNTGSVTVGGVVFSRSIDNFASPTVNGPGGNLGGTVSAAVPEPSSVLLTGIGAVAVVGLYFRRNLHARQAV